MVNFKSHIHLAIGYFLVIGILGLALRMYQIFDIPANYRFIVHTHSHIALLGWFYTALTTLIYIVFFGDKPILKKYKRIFWCTQITILGMMFSFPFTGYALFFNSVFNFIFDSFLLVYILFFETGNTRTKTKTFLQTNTIGLMVYGYLKPWSLGPRRHHDDSGK